jgi:casein kinase II subunit beta
MGDSDSEDDSNSWINWFCGLKGNEFLCEVDSSFIDDVFNLYGIRSVIEDFRDVQDLILGDPPDGDGTKHELFEEAKNFYGLVHARFIVTMRGISLMLEKYENKDFGVCPRYFCKGCALLPMGLSDDLNVGRALLFCPRCEELYNVPSGPDGSAAESLDGAFFGPTFPHMMMLSKPQLLPPKTNDSYIPRVFGFRVAGMEGRKSLLQSMHVGGARGTSAAYSAAGGGSIDEDKAAEPSLGGGESLVSSGSGKAAIAISAAAVGSESSAGAVASATVDSTDRGGSTGANAMAMESSRTNIGRATEGEVKASTLSKVSGQSLEGCLSVGPDGWVRMRTTPLTSAWKEHGKRPFTDDFHDDDEDEAEARSSRKRRRND